MVIHHGTIRKTSPKKTNPRLELNLSTPSNEDVFPIKNGDVPASHVSFQDPESSSHTS